MTVRAPAHFCDAAARLTFESRPPALKKILEWYGSPEPRAADKSSTLYHATIRDAGTMIEDVYVARLKDVWEMKTYYIPNTSNVRNICGRQASFGEIWRLIEHYNRALRVNWDTFDGTLAAFCWYLYKFEGGSTQLPRWVDVEPIRWELIRNKDE